MRLLLDECIDWDFRHGFAGHECHTAQFAGLKGKSNGELLRSAEALGYQVVITVDRNIQHQQNLAGRKISILALQVKTNQLEDLLQMQAAVLNALEKILPGQFLLVLAADEAD
jgi:predicted nuclease of predicted toxin-antitoxin system